MPQNDGVPKVGENPPDHALHLAEGVGAFVTLAQPKLTKSFETLILFFRSPSLRCPSPGGQPAAGVVEKIIEGFHPPASHDRLRDYGMDEQFQNRLRFLRKANTEGMPHSDRSLFEHLLGTWRLLVAWDARPALCDAGLFHSVYGTDHYEVAVIPFTMRSEVQQLIGDEAESLVSLFCMMRRETLYQNLNKNKDFSVQHRLTDERIPLTEGQFHDLVTLSFANCLEAFPRCSWIARQYIRSGLRRFRGIAIDPAQSAFDRIEVQWWEFWK